MADNSTPPAGTPASKEVPSTPPAGTGTNATPDTVTKTPELDEHGIPKDPVARATHFETRYKEATGQLTPLQQKNARYREVFGELDGDHPVTPSAPAAPAAKQGDPQFVTKDDFQDWTLSQNLARIPSLAPHKDEIKKVMSPTVSYAEAVKIVADRHNITLGPKPDALDGMPTDTGGGARPPVSNEDFTPEQKAAMLKEGKDPEKAKKHVATINKAWSRAMKR